MPQPLLTDLNTKNLNVIFYSMNPGLKSAWDRHRSGRSSRFYKTWHLAGFTSYRIELSNDASILDFGYGLTTAVASRDGRVLVTL